MYALKHSIKAALLHITKAINKKNQNFCDNGNLNSSCVTKFGGNYSNGDNAGVYYLNVNNTASNTNANIGGHEMF